MSARQRGVLPSIWGSRIASGAGRTAAIALALLGMFLTTPRIAHANITIGSSAVEAVVADAGRFSIGLRDGDPRLATDDGRILLYGHPAPQTSFTSARVNGQDVILTDAQVVSAPRSSGGAVRGVWKVDGVEYEQLISVVRGSVTDREDTIRVQYTMRNTGDRARSAGIRILLDTMLGDNDGAPFRIPGVGQVTTEMDFSGGASGIPDYFQAFDSFEEPGVVSHALIADERLGEQPDRFVVAAWPGAFNTVWDFEHDPSRVVTHDSAALLYWEPKNLAPGESRRVAVEYGVSQLAQDLRPPLATRVQPLPTRLSSTGNQMTVYVQNTSARTVGNARVSLQLSEGLEVVGASTADLGTLEPGQEAGSVAFTVRPTVFSLLRSSSMSYRVEVSGDGAATKRIALTTSAGRNVPRAADGTPLNPVILVPGIMGSWNSGAMLERPSESRLKRFPAIASSVNDPSKRFVSDGTWNMDPIFDTFDNITRLLKANGYVVGKTLFFAPYDWRFPSTQTAEYCLSPVVDYATEKSGGGKPVIIAHSMGGIVARQYAQNPENSGKLAAIIAVATPNHGSSKAYLNWEGGVDQDPFNTVALAGLASAWNSDLPVYASIRRYVTALQELLPTYDFLTDRLMRIRRGVSSMYWRNPTLPRLNQNVKQRLGTTELVTVSGVDQDTRKYVSVGSEKGSKEERFADGSPTWIHLGGEFAAEGDATVLQSSVELPGFPNRTVIAGHGEAIGCCDKDERKVNAELSLEVISGLMALEQDTAVRTASMWSSEGGRDVDGDVNWLAIFVACPVDVSIETSSGEALVSRSETTAPLPYFFDSVEGTGAVAFIPVEDAAAYEVKVRGTGSGDATVTMAFTRGMETTTTFERLVVRRGSLDQVSVKASKDESGAPIIESSVKRISSGGGGHRRRSSSSGWLWLVILGVAGSVGYLLWRYGGLGAGPGSKRQATPVFRVSVSSDSRTWEFELAEEQMLSIGRAVPDEAGVRLDDPKVSSLHVNLHPRRTTSGELVLVIEDQQSSNGTFVNGQRIESGTIRPGAAEILVGKTKLSVQVEPTAQL